MLALPAFTYKRSITKSQCERKYANEVTYPKFQTRKKPRKFPVNSDRFTKSASRITNQLINLIVMNKNENHKL